MQSTRPPASMRHSDLERRARHQYNDPSADEQRQQIRDMAALGFSNFAIAGACRISVDGYTRADDVQTLSRSTSIAKIDELPDRRQCQNGCKPEDRRPALRVV